MNHSIWDSEGVARLQGGRTRGHWYFREPLPASPFSSLAGCQMDRADQAALPQAQKGHPHATGG